MTIHKKNKSSKLPLIFLGAAVVALVTACISDSNDIFETPVIEKTATGVKVTVGSVPHPMEEKHYIEWIELIADGITYRKFLKPGQKPEAEFNISSDKIQAREYCNIHGLWKS